MKSRRCSPSAMPVAMRLEQLDRLAGFRSVEHLGQHALHVAFVIFVRAVDVEEFQARPMRRQFFFFDVAVGDRLIELMLAPAVKIHRLELAQTFRRPVVVEAFAAVAIGRRRGGIDERRARRRAPVEQAQRQAEIVLHHQVAVGCGGVGNGAHVDDRLELAAVEPGHQFGRRHQIGHPALGQIAPFGVVLAEQVVDHDVAGARLVEARHHVRSDESGPAGDQKHAQSFVPAKLCPSPWTGAMLGRISL